MRQIRVLLLDLASDVVFAKMSACKTLVGIFIMRAETISIFCMDFNVELENSCKIVFEIG